MLQDHRQLAILLARARVGFGAAMLLLGRPVAALALGIRDGGGRAALRLAGGRDVALGLGALTSIRERTQDAEWVSMGAAADGVDALTGLFTPGLPVRARLMGVVAVASTVIGLESARRFADERTAREDAPA